MSSPHNQSSHLPADASGLPAVSVLVVTYNQEETLGRTLDSILGQDLTESWEIVVCDDASRDGTAAVAHRYAEAHPGRIRVIARERNLGVQGNYFDGVRQCRADLIADCAGDDYWTDPTKLRRQLELMRSHPEVSLVHTGWSFLYPDGSTLRHHPSDTLTAPIMPGRRILEAVVTREERLLIHLCSAMFRRQPLLRALDTDTDLMLNPAYGLEDVQVTAVEAAAGDIAYIPEDMLRYSVGHSSVSSADSMAKEFDFTLSTFLVREALAKRYGVSDHKMSPYRRHIITHLASRAYRAASADRMHRLHGELNRLSLRSTLKMRVYSLLLKLGIKNFF